MFFSFYDVFHLFAAVQITEMEPHIENQFEKVELAIKLRKAKSEIGTLEEKLVTMEARLEEAKAANYELMLKASGSSEFIDLLEEGKVCISSEQGVGMLDAAKMAIILKSHGVLGKVMRDVETWVAMEPGESSLDPPRCEERALRAVAKAFITPETYPSSAPWVAERAEERVAAAEKRREEIYNELLQVCNLNPSKDSNERI